MSAYPSLIPIALALLGATALPGCSDAGHPQEADAKEWVFYTDMGLPDATLTYRGEGMAVGPDLQRHPASLYSLLQPVLLKDAKNVVWVNYTVALTEDFHLLSSHSPCNAFDEHDGTWSCSDLAQLNIPMSEETLSGSTLHSS